MTAAIISENQQSWTCGSLKLQGCLSVRLINKSEYLFGLLSYFVCSFIVLLYREVEFTARTVASLHA